MIHEFPLPLIDLFYTRGTGDSLATSQTERLLKPSNWEGNPQQMFTNRGHGWRKSTCGQSSKCCIVSYFIWRVFLFAWLFLIKKIFLKGAFHFSQGFAIYLLDLYTTACLGSPMQNVTFHDIWSFLCLDWDWQHVTLHTLLNYHFHHHSSVACW